ncbi:MAG TPA: signal peptidase I [Pyrinomonadaceae bacterium]
MFRRNNRQAYPFGDVGVGDDRDIEVRRLEQESRRHFWAEARLLMRDLAVALMIATLVIVFIVQPVKVEGSSMLPRLHGGVAEEAGREGEEHSDRIFVNKLIYYGMPRLERGDIVVFWFPEEPSKSYIKRVIGLPGEIVHACDNHVMIDGRALDEPYLDPQRNVNRYNLGRPSADSQLMCEQRVGCQGCVYVKPSHYFVMGDNRDNSSDSRSWGLVPEKYIYGKALFRYWPPSEASVIRHEGEE